MGFFFTCIYLFFAIIRPQDWAMLELIALRPVFLTQIFAIGFTIFELASGKLKLPSIKQPWWFIMTGLFVAISISNVANFKFAEAIEAFSEFGKIYITFLVIWINLNSLKRIKIFSILIVTMGSFIALHCVLLHETGKGFGNAEAAARSIGDVGGSDGVVQAAFYGIFGDPNDASQLFVIVLPICFFLLLRFRSLWIKGICLIMIITLILGIYATESRGGFIAMAIAIAVTFRSFFTIRSFIIIAFCGVIAFFLFAPARLRGGVVDTSSSHRVHFWGAATNALKSNPLFGVGYHRITEYTPHHKAVHNSFVEAYSEIGIFGYFFWITALIFSIYSMLRLSKALPESNEESFQIIWMNCIVAGIIGGSAAGFFLSRAYILTGYIIYAMVAACYDILSSKIGIVATNNYCHINTPLHWLTWFGLCLANMIFIYIAIIVLNIVTA